MDLRSRCHVSCEKTESILKAVVRHFFIGNKVSSTLVMDSLYGGLESLESQNNSKKYCSNYPDAEELPVPIVSIEKDCITLLADALLLVELAAIRPLLPKDAKGPKNFMKDGNAGEEFNSDPNERDERHLTEMGRRCIEVFVLAHVFSKIEVEVVAWRKQEELIHEEEAARLAMMNLKGRKGTVDNRKKPKTEQGICKSKAKERKGKDLKFVLLV